MRECILEVNPKGSGWFVYHFVDPDLGVELFFEKKRPTQGEGVDVKIAAHLNWGLKKIPCRAYQLFFGDKKAPQYHPLIVVFFRFAQPRFKIRGNIGGSRG